MMFDFNYLQLISAFVLICFTFVIHRYKCHSYWTSRGIKGPKPSVIFGNSLELTSKPLLKYDAELLAEFGDLVGMYHGATPVLLTSDAKIVHEVTIKKFYAFTDRRDYNGNEILISMLLGTNGLRWRRMRKLMSPAFSSGKMRAMSPLMLGPIARAVDRLSKSSHVDIGDIIRRMTLETIVRTAFGVELASESERETAHKHGLRVLEVTKSRMFLGTILPFFVKKWLDFAIFNKESLDYFAGLAKAIINQRRTCPELKSSCKDFVDLMLEASDESNDRLTQVELVANCVLVLLGGLDTASNLLTTTLFSLAHHPQVQDKLRDEISSVKCSNAQDLENNADSLRYLDAVLDEASRIYPPVGRTERIAVDDVDLENGLHLKKGTVVTFAISTLHKHPKYWSQPDEYIPERFLPQNQDKINQYAFMPFHVGPRNCLGKRFALIEAKLALVEIIRQFKLSPSEKTKYPLTFPRAASNLLTINDPVYVRVEKL